MFRVQGVVEMLGQKQGLDRAAPLPRGSLMEERTRKYFLRRWEWLLLQVERCGASSHGLGWPWSGLNIFENTVWRSKARCP